MAEGNGGGIAKALGLKGKASTLPPITDEELYEEAVTRAISGSHEMRKEIKHWRTRAEVAEAELQTRTHEHEAKRAALRGDNDSLRKQLSDLGHKHEFYMRRALELTTKCNDLEMFVAHELTRIHETTQQQTLGLVSAINNTQTQLNEAAKALAEGITHMVGGSAKSLRDYLDDMHKRAAAAEYAPSELKPLPEDGRSILTDEQEAELQTLAARLAPKRNGGDEEHQSR
jgi:hypothetical protein